MPAQRQADALAPVAVDPFSVPGWIDWLGGWVARHPRTCIRLGNWETRVLADRIEGVQIDRPLYICGLARSGSTVLLETLARHPTVATHAYRDFPFVFAPYFWNWYLDRAQREGAAVERAHGDGIAVTPRSPEAMEEPLWMAFFPHLHAAGHSDVLGGAVRAPEFERFYTDHLRKLLWLRGGRRYLAKGNYNLTRMEFLAKLFPDARFIVPVRHPVSQVASLARQHRRFCARHRADPRALRYMQRAGHFEFGLDRRPIDLGDPDEVEAIRAAWRDGREAEGLALLWNAVHRYVADRLERNEALRKAVLVVPHEQLNAAPVATLRSVFEHCELACSESELEAAAQARAQRNVYEPILTQDDRRTIERVCAQTAARFGY